MRLSDQSPVSCELPDRDKRTEMGVRWSSEKVEVKVAQSCLTLCDPMSAQSMRFSSQEYWSGLPFPFPGDLPNPGTEPRSPAFQTVKNPPEMRETWFDPWVGKIPLGRERLPTPVFSPGESPWTEEPGRWPSMGSQIAGYD